LKGPKVVKAKASVCVLVSEGKSGKHRTGKVRIPAENTLVEDLAAVDLKVNVGARREEREGEGEGEGEEEEEEEQEEKSEWSWCLSFSSSFFFFVVSFLLQYFIISDGLVR